MYTSPFSVSHCPSKVEPLSISLILNNFPLCGISSLGLPPMGSDPTRTPATHIRSRERELSHTRISHSSHPSLRPCPQHSFSSDTLPSGNFLSQTSSTHSGLLVLRIRGPDWRSAVGLGVNSPGRPRPLESRATSGDSKPCLSPPLLTSGGPPGPPGPSPGWGRAGDLGRPLRSGHRKRHHSFVLRNSP